MTTKWIKKLLLIVLATIGAGFIGYLFFAPYAYVVRFTSSHSPYSIYSFVYENTSKSTETTNGLKLRQTLEFENKQDVYLHWDIHYDGNISDVTIKVNFTESTIIEKLRILTFRSTLLHPILKRIKGIHGKMLEDRKSFQWTKPKTDQLFECECLCVGLASKIRKKPQLMNQHVDALAHYAQNNTNNSPRLYINDIDFAEQSFSYEFCFPISENGVIHPIPDDYYIKKQAEVSLNSIDFYGNFAATPRFWAKLYDSLKTEEKTIKFPIIEVFLDSPFSGKSDKDWHSKIYF